MLVAVGTAGARGNRLLCCRARSHGGSPRCRIAGDHRRPRLPRARVRCFGLLQRRRRRQRQRRWFSLRHRRGQEGSGQVPDPGAAERLSEGNHREGPPPLRQARFRRGHRKNLPGGNHDVWRRLLYTEGRRFEVQLHGHEGSRGEIRRAPGQRGRAGHPVPSLRAGGIDDPQPRRDHRCPARCRLPVLAHRRRLRFFRRERRRLWLCRGWRPRPSTLRHQRVHASETLRDDPRARPDGVLHRDLPPAGARHGRGPARHRRKPLARRERHRRAPPGIRVARRELPGAPSPSRLPGLSETRAAAAGGRRRPL
mmetsp:Transcript_22592/g.47845  ORF Transcript_22592/g.47845 Transcript_22592/m.47845 type:complete len:310 (+) Transcript_22592:401-1330(+)